MVRAQQGTKAVDNRLISLVGGVAGRERRRAWIFWETMPAAKDEDQQKWWSVERGLFTSR